MFDVGFLELVVIMVLGLLVLGPERLPKAAQKVGYWFGKARRYVEGMKSQVEAEFDGAEVKRLLHNQEVQIRELQDKITDTESYIDTEYHNQFDDENDPGTSPETVEEAKPSEPQYDIIEEDAAVKTDDVEENAVKKNSAEEGNGEEDKAWAEDPHSNKPFTEYKQTKHAQQIASANQPDESQSAGNNAVGDKAQ